VRDCLTKLCRTGIFEKLQQVMQKEKERDIDFSKKLQAGTRPDGKSFAFTLSALSLLSPFKTSLLHRQSFIVGFFFLFIFWSLRGCIKLILHLFTHMDINV
jgi:hypothetical protein